MRQRTKKTGFSLTEILVSMSIIGILAGIGLPAVKQVVKSFESASRLEGVVSAAMSNARAMAQARDQYIGIRFQQTPQGEQYMVFIEQDNDVGPGHVLLQMNPGFRALKGKNPIRLPKRGAVMDLRIKNNYIDIEAYLTDRSVKVEDVFGVVDLVASNAGIDQEWELLDAMTFSVVFSPQGKLVITNLRVAHSNSNGGEVFNRSTNDSMFIQDDIYTVPDAVQGLQLEPSRNNFIIVDKNKFNSIPAGERYSRYLQYLKAVYINPYTGELISN